MKITKILFTACLLAAITLKAQNYERAMSIGFDRSIYVDTSGYIYTTGSFCGTIDFDPGSGTANRTSKGRSDVFVKKMDASGNFLWAKSFGGKYWDFPSSINLDASGNIYILASILGVSEFDPILGINSDPKNWPSSFIHKMDTSGNFIWAKALSTSPWDQGESSIVDASGNIYTTGHFYTTVDFDPGPGTTNLTSKGSRDIFVQKMDASGNFLWAKSFEDDFYAYTSINLDAFGNVYTTGCFDETIDFDPGSGTANLTAKSFADIFVQKMDASGNFLWAKALGHSDKCQQQINIDSSGNVYIIRDFKGKLYFDPKSDYAPTRDNDILVQKLDDSGNLLWEKFIGSDLYHGYVPSAIDKFGNVYIIGSFLDSIDFDTGNVMGKLTSEGLADIFVYKMDTFGNFLWAKSFGSKSWEFTISITVDASNNVYIIGSFDETIAFNTRAGVVNLTPARDDDIFICKMDEYGNLLWVKPFYGR